MRKEGRKEGRRKEGRKERARVHGVCVYEIFMFIPRESEKENFVYIYARVVPTQGWF